MGQHIPDDFDIQLSKDAAKQVFDSVGIQLFTATVYYVFADGTVDLQRDTNVQVDGTTPPDDGPSVVIGQNRLVAGDEVVCFSRGGHAYVWGKIIDKTTPQPTNDLESLKEYVDSALTTIRQDISGYVSGVEFSKHKNSTDHDGRYLRREGQGATDNGQGLGRNTVDDRLSLKSGQNHEHDPHEIHGLRSHDNKWHNPPFQRQ